jgi:hypothetical protein
LGAAAFAAVFAADFAMVYFLSVGDGTEVELALDERLEAGE